MLNIPQSLVSQFSGLLQTHRVHISACDVFFQNIRMLVLGSKRFTMTRSDFETYYKNFVWDIELQTSPIDSFVPCDEEPQLEQKDGTDEQVIPPLFVVNQTVPEYGRIKNRITLEELKSTLPETHPSIMALVNNTKTLDDIIDEIFVYYCMFKYIDQIEKIRLYIFSNMTPVIEYVVNNITIDDLKQYLVSPKINVEKIQKHSDLIFFKPDFNKICEFYKENDCDFPTFDLENLIDRLFSNICLKSDIYIILGIYLTASFAVADIKNHSDSPCVNYVRDVLSII